MVSLIRTAEIHIFLQITNLHDFSCENGEASAEDILFDTIIGHIEDIIMGKIEFAVFVLHRPDLSLPIFGWIISVALLTS